MLVLFFIGLFFFLITLGAAVKLITGRWFDDDFVSRFTIDGFTIFFRIAGGAIAALFVYCIIALLQTL